MADESTADVCQFVGEPRPDIAGIGIIVGFTGQALLSLLLAVWVFFFSRHGRLDVLHDEGSDEHEIELKRLEMVQDILMIGNDIQLMTGVALMFTVFSTYKTIDLYHLHLIYDLVSFVGVSIAAALVCFTFCTARKAEYHQRRQRRATGLADFDTEAETKGGRRSIAYRLSVFPRWVAKTAPLLVKLNKKNPIIRKFAFSGRYRATYIFAVSFLTLAVLFDRKLSNWDLNVRGACYDTSWTSAHSAHHPTADRYYLWTSFSWMITVMIFSMFDGKDHRRFILTFAFLQFPLHFYMMLALRSANNGLLGVTAEEAAEKAAEKRAVAAVAVRAVWRAGKRVLLAREEEEEENENDWDFGQTTAVLLLTVALVEAAQKAMTFIRFERGIKRHRRQINAEQRDRPRHGRQDQIDEQQRRLDSEERGKQGGCGERGERGDRGELGELGELGEYGEQQPLNDEGPSPWKQRQDMVLVSTVSSSANDTPSAYDSAGNNGRAYDVEAGGLQRRFS